MILLPSLLVLLVFCAGGEAQREAKDEEFPFHVSIRSNDQYLCGGAIIAPAWILTSCSCVFQKRNVTVGYGSADFNNQKLVNSLEIVCDLERRKLALIHLEKTIKFSQTAKQAKLPTETVQLKNSTKLSAWKVNRILNAPVGLYVVDKFNVILEDYRTSSASPLKLDDDEFYGVAEDDPNSVLLLSNAGSIVSKAGIALGLSKKEPEVPYFPVLYIKLSLHDQWLKDTLGNDAHYLSWVNSIPKDSAALPSASNIILLGVLSIFLVFL